MGSVASYSSRLKILQRQAAALASAGPSLAALLDQEASRLILTSEASRLRALRSSIRQELDWARSVEDAARYGHSKAKLTSSLVGLGVGIAIKMTTQDKHLRAFSYHLLKNLGGKEFPFGTVMVCIGPRGMPDDVAVISISRLARESDREESQVTEELEGRGCLLFSERAFSLLMDKLTDDVQEGRLALPISTGRLPQIERPSSLKPVARSLCG